MNTLFDNFLPREKFRNKPIKVLHTGRQALTRKHIKQNYLLLLFDYYYIHLVNYFNKRAHHTNNKPIFFKKIIDCHNGGYLNPPMDAVFHGGDPAENARLQQMLTEMSRVQLSMLRLNFNSESALNVLVRILKFKFPVVASLVSDDKIHRHSVECIGVERDVFVLRNAYANNEIVKVNSQTLLDGEYFKIGSINYKIVQLVSWVPLYYLFALQLKKKLPDEDETRREFNKMTAVLREVRANLKKMVAQFLTLPVSDLPDPPQCIEEDTCALLMRVLTLLYFYKPEFTVVQNIIAKRGRCLSLHEWSSLTLDDVADVITLDHAEHALRIFKMWKNIRSAADIIHKNEIDGYYYVPPHIRKYLKAEYPRILDQVGERKKSDSSTQLLESPTIRGNPLPMMLDILETDSGQLGEYIHEILSEEYGIPSPRDAPEPDAPRVAIEVPRDRYSPRDVSSSDISPPLIPPRKTRKRSSSSGPLEL